MKKSTNSAHTSTYFEIYRSKDKGKTQFTRWRFILRKGIVARGGEAFTRYEAKYSIRRLKQHLADGTYKGGVTISEIDTWFWRIKAPNGRIVALSTDYFKTRDGATHSLDRFIENALNAPIFKKMTKEGCK